MKLSILTVFLCFLFAVMIEASWDPKLPPLSDADDESDNKLVYGASEKNLVGAYIVKVYKASQLNEDENSGKYFFKKHFGWSGSKQSSWFIILLMLALILNICDGFECVSYWFSSYQDTKSFMRYTNEFFILLNFSLIFLGMRWLIFSVLKAYDQKYKYIKSYSDNLL